MDILPLGRRCDRVVRALSRVAEGPRFTTFWVREFSKIISIHSAGNGYPAPSRAGEGKGGEEEDWY